MRPGVWGLAWGGSAGWEWDTKGKKGEEVARDGDTGTCSPDIFLYSSSFFFHFNLVCLPIVYLLLFSISKYFTNINCGTCLTGYCNFLKTCTKNDSFNSLYAINFHKFPPNFNS